MKSIIISFFVLLSIASSVTYADIAELSVEKQQCLNALSSEYAEFNFDNYLNTSEFQSSNDGLSGVDFPKLTPFTKTSYVYGEKSQMSKADLFRVFSLYGIDISDSFFYDNELQFIEISQKQNNTFLACSFTQNTHLSGESLSDLKKGDATVAYSGYQPTFNITESVISDTQWRKIDIIKTYKDTLGKKDILESKTTFFIPKNKSLEGYYDMYELALEQSKARVFFKNKIDYFSLDNPIVQETYNENGIIIQAPFRGGNIIHDIHGIRYMHINGFNFFNDYMEYRRHHIFNALVQDESPLAKDVYVIGDKWDNETKKYAEGQNTWTQWVLYFLGEESLNLDAIDVVPYFSRARNIERNSYYQVADHMSSLDFKNYIHNVIFSDEEIQNPDQFIKKYKSIAVDGEFKKILGLHKSFTREYEAIKGLPEDDAKVIDFSDKYQGLFGNDPIFTTDTQVIQDQVETNDPASQGDDGKDQTADLPGDDIVDEDTPQSLTLYIILILAGLICILGGSLYYKKKK
ncbi:hypothetical protein MK079_04295 [Candidatus Gracilibacteria bacterium]|nr:hypothetical protein [Candidatus Gracilibacteria bacterium]